nr:MAG TPA: hypothetical protein [Caudoviricetes sp.]
MSDGIFNATGGACEDAEEMYEHGYDITDILERENMKSTCRGGVIYSK